VRKPLAYPDPADRNGGGGDGVFEDQRPAHHPRDQFADHGIRVGVCASRRRGIIEAISAYTQRGQRADDAGARTKLNIMPGPALFTATAVSTKMPGADDGADAGASSARTHRAGA
jgi:hypothetical protein